ncbi:aquaporin Z [Leucobacter denitrificans]|uniref:Aquaporin Z n=1 Tax=Leucobacter denitrificans TaxID=683042 RepID=A0A7G9S6Y9_9MICO|nr:aquaporin Z [Leucobacter denitrificans]QNN63614.1 aquaporin Z [Leucobacter denitrificans]
MSDTLTQPTTGSRLAAEVVGTFILVLGGVGTAVFAAGFVGDPSSPVNVGFLGVALAFGLTIVVGVYAFGPISGGHFNPAVTLGLAAAGRFAWKDVAGYVIAQIVGGAIASSLIFAVAMGQPGGYDGTLGANGYGDASPGGYSLLSVGLIEVVLTAVFLFVIIGATSDRAPAGFAGIAIGLTLTLIHLISIPISNTSVNPARSIASAIYGGSEALIQLWAFLVFPALGGLLAGWLFKPLFEATRRVPSA